jgi:hypothetical protein
MSMGELAKQGWKGAGPWLLDIPAPYPFEGAVQLCVFRETVPGEISYSWDVVWKTWTVGAGRYRKTVTEAALEARMFGLGFVSGLRSNVQMNESPLHTGSQGGKYVLVFKNLDSLTIAEAREAIPQAQEILNLFKEAPDSATSRGDELPFPVGTPVYCRTVTYHAVGRIAGRRGQWLDLDEASYIGNDGRFSVATESGVQNAPNAEIERVGNGGRMVVNLDAVVDVTRHIEELPKKTQ